MARIIYPINDKRYTAEDVEIYNIPRTSGVYAVLDFDCSLSGDTLTIGKGLAWIKNGEFSGKTVAFTEPETLTLEYADDTYNRYDVIAIRYDATKTEPELIIKKGVASASPEMPTRSTETYLYELYLYSILREKGEPFPLFANITDLRRDPEYCGIMRDSVTSVVDVMRETLYEDENGAGQLDLISAGGMTLEPEEYGSLIATIKYSNVSIDMPLYKVNTTSRSWVFAGETKTPSNGTFTIELQPVSGGFSVETATQDSGSSPQNAKITKLVGIPEKSQGYVAIDSLYNPESHNAQSGEAVKQAIDEALENFEGGGDVEIPENIETTDNKVTNIDENSTDEQYPSAKAVREFIDNTVIETGMVDGTYDPTSSNAQSGYAVAEAVGPKQDKLVSGQNIKTINGKSILGSGDMVVVGGVEGDINTVVLEDINEIKNSIGEKTYIQDITDTLTITNGWYHRDTGVLSSNANAQASDIFAVKQGEKYFVTGAYGYAASLIVTFDENNTYLPDKSVFSSENANTSVDDYEYIVPEGVAYIGCSTRLTVAADKTRGRNLTIKKEVTKLNDVQEVIEETAQEIADSVSFDVTNVCPNGNFEDTSGWTTPTGVTLTVADNVATVKRNGTGSSARLNGVLDRDIFPHTEGDVYFISAKIKTPKNQKNCGIAININSNDGYEEIGKSTSTYDEYTMVCGVKRFKTNFAGYWNFVIGATINYNVTDFTFQVKEVTLIKVADTSYTDEEIKNIYSAILEQNGGYIDGTVNVVGVGGFLNKFNYEFENENIITENKVVTVGANGDFETINSALRYLSKFYPAYLNGGIECEIKILDGTIINEQIKVERIDLSHISITTDNADNTVQVDVTGWGGITHDTRGNKPFFSAEYGARLPCIKCLFSCIVPEGGWIPDKYTDENGNEIEANVAVGYFCNRGSTGVIAGETTYSGSTSQGLANVGFENFYDNIIANNNSEIVLREAIARNAGRYGVMARHISRVSARSADITNCADTGAYADRSSMMDVRFADVSGCNNGLQCFNTSNMTAVETIANNITNIVADSREGSVINCAEMTIDGVKDVFKVLNGGTIIATSTAPTNVSGTLNSKEKNTVDINGIIYG